MSTNAEQEEPSRLYEQLYKRLAHSRRWQAAQATLGYYARGLYHEISQKNLFLWAQAIAFKVLVTVVPIVVLSTGVAGRVLQSNNAFSTVARFIRDFLPPAQSTQLIEFLNQLQSASGTVIGLGGAGLFLSAVSLFITLRIAVSNAFEQDWHESRSVLGGYLFDVRMVVQVGILFTLTIGLSTLVGPLLNEISGAVPGLDAVIRRTQALFHALKVFVPLLITGAMFYQLYYFVPKPPPSKTSALIGAAVAGVLWEGAKQAFAYYATYVGHFDQYAASGAGLSALGNTFGLIIAFVFWVYFSGIVLMLGAVVASLREHRHVTSRSQTANEAPAAEAASHGPAPPPAVPPASPPDISSRPSSTADS